MAIDPHAVNHGGRALASRGVTEPPSVTLGMPAGAYLGVARLVTAGFASRFDLRYEVVDDLQMAIETVLRTAFQSDERATIGIAHDARSLAVWIGPVGPNVLKRRLHEHDDPGGLELGTMLSRLVGHVEMQVEPVPSILLQVKLPDDET
jgi:hypothetical protein